MKNNQSANISDMEKTKKIIKLSLFLFLFFGFVPKDVYAYLDPGSGSYILQILVAAFLGASFTLKLYWKKIISVFIKERKTEEKSEKHKED